MLIVLVRVGVTVQLDRQVHKTIPPPAVEWTTKSAELLATAAQWQVQGGVLVVIALLAGWQRRDLRPAWLSAAALLVLGTTCWLLKRAVDQVGPYDAHHGLITHGTAFPSGHTAGALLLGVLGAHLSGSHSGRAARVMLLGLGATWALAVGLSRLRLEVHWLSDVVGGWLLGGAVVALVLLVNGGVGAGVRQKPRGTGELIERIRPPVDQRPISMH